MIDETYLLIIITPKTNTKHTEKQYNSLFSIQIKLNKHYFMKKRNNLLFSGLIAFTLFAGLTFTSCEKETMNKPTTTTEREPNRLHPIEGVITIGSACGDVTSCGPIGAYGNRYNMMTFTKTATTIAVFPTLRYSIYKSIGLVAGVNTYKKVVEFTCNKDIIQYASSLLENATSHYLVTTVTDNPAPLDTVTLSGGILSVGTAFPFTTGSQKGGTCGGGGIAGF